MYVIRTPSISLLEVNVELCGVQLYGTKSTWGYFDLF